MSILRFEGLKMTIVAAFLRSDFTVCNRNFPKGSLVAIRKYEGTACPRTFYTLDNRGISYRSIRLASNYGILFQSLQLEVTGSLGGRTYKRVEQHPDSLQRQADRRTVFVRDGGFYPICQSAVTMPVDMTGAGLSTSLTGDGMYMHQLSNHHDSN